MQVEWWGKNIFMGEMQGEIMQMTVIYLQKAKNPDSPSANPDFSREGVMTCGPLKRLDPVVYLCCRFFLRTGKESKSACALLPDGRNDAHLPVPGRP